jgi:putative signal transducing protein
MATNDPVEVYAAKDITEAQFVRNILENAGIESTIVGEALGTALGDLPAFHAAPRIWVCPEDANRARLLVEDYQKRLTERVGAHDSDEHEVPFCYHCGSEVVLGEPKCWACGKELEWAVQNR